MTNGTFQIVTSAHMEFLDITPTVAEIVKKNVSSGVLYLFNPHTTAGLTINEGADPDVQRDLILGLNHIIPNSLPFRHMEGNSQSHIMALLTGNDLTIHIENNTLLLGTWQRIFFGEFDGPRTRKVHWKFIS